MKLRILLTVIFTLCSISVLAQERSKKPVDTVNGLKLTVNIKEPKESYLSTDNFEIGIKLTNTGKTPITIYNNMGWGWSSSLFSAVTDNKGKRLFSPILADALDIPPFKSEDFISIKPGEEINKKRFIALNNYKIEKPGTYKVIVWYSSPVPKDFAPEGLEIFSRENGRLQSQPVVFEVEN